jgi:hypothetical protein
MIDLNDQLATANGVAGGKQTVHTAGLNWYVNRNVRFMFNYLHGDIAKQVSARRILRRALFQYGSRRNDGAFPTVIIASLACWRGRSTAGPSH